METVLCKVRDMRLAIRHFEVEFENAYGISLNEGMALCCLSSGDNLSSGELGGMLGLTCSNASKVIASVEKKGYVERALGKDDRRKMFFRLTPEGIRMSEKVKCCDIPVPEGLLPVMHGD